MYGQRATPGHLKSRSSTTELATFSASPTALPFIGFVVAKPSSSGDPRLRFFAYGTPAPQGSKRHVGNGVMVESSKAVKPWRQDVIVAARDAYQGEPLDGALELVITFWMPRPKTARKTARWKTTTPDSSKLVRSTEDALVQAGTVRDDARFVRHVIEKRLLPVEGGPSGADITINVLENGERT